MADEKEATVTEEQPVSIPTYESEPVAEAEPESEDAEVASEDEPESAEEEEGEEEAEEAEGDEPEAEEPAPRKNRPGKAQRRIMRLEAELEARDRELERALNQSKGVEPGPVPQREEIGPEPRQDDFDDYSEYLVKRAEWVAEKTVAGKLVEAREKFQKDQRDQQQRTIQEAYNAKVEAASEKYDDFEEVALNPDIHITDDMATAILEADNGTDVQYYLGSHPKEAERIARLSPVSQVREIGKLEAKLAKPVAKKTTNAPKPVKPVAGSGSSAIGQKDPNKMTTEQYVKWRQAGNG